MPKDRKNSPWAYDDSGIECPRCNSHRIIRILDDWALRRGIQMYRCSNCGKKFYDKGYDDYQPTFRR